MHRKATNQTTALAVAIGVAIVGLSLNSLAQTFKVLHYFTGSPDGAASYSQLAFDSHGNLFGTTIGGGIGFGTVFEMQPNGDGVWTESVIHDFRIMDGEFPGAGVTFDRFGALYGTTEGGNVGNGLVYGSVYQLTPQPDGTWKPRVLHLFSGLPDGWNSQAAPTIDNRGHIYGDTDSGGIQNQGTFFEVDQVGLNSWSFKTSYKFPGGNGGAYPGSKLLLTANGDLLGTSYAGGAHNYGGVFKLHRQADGTWSFTLLYSFTGHTDGWEPGSGVIADAAGNLYGTTITGSNGSDNGVVYKLHPNLDGSWSQTVLYAFRGYPNDGAHPYAPVVFDSAGNLYGTTISGGPYNTGTVFRLTPSQSGYWTETILHTFDNGPDGQLPFGGIIMDSAGNLYGTALQQGQTNGVVYEVSP